MDDFISKKEVNIDDNIQYIYIVVKRKTRSINEIEHFSKILKRKTKS